jgi:hypothetical protein
MPVCGTGRFVDIPLIPDVQSVPERYETIVWQTPEIMDLITEEKCPFIVVLHVKC